ncbi:MAG: hypothetical protein RL885_27915 [Planctomycetota bacterium]
MKRFLLILLAFGVGRALLHEWVRPPMKSPVPNQAVMQKLRESRWSKPVRTRVHQRFQEAQRRGANRTEVRTWEETRRQEATERDEGVVWPDKR